MLLLFQYGRVFRGVHQLPCRRYHARELRRRAFFERGFVSNRQYLECGSLFEHRSVEFELLLCSK